LHKAARVRGLDAYDEISNCGYRTPAQKL
jgi:hypothetical protein